MATITVNGSSLGNALNDLLTAAEIVPGDSPSYQLCKTIYAYHPLGAKMVEAPIRIAQSQERELSVPDSPEDDCVKAFKAEWKAISADKHIFNTRRLSRVYGIASIACITEGQEPNQPLEFAKLATQTIGFNVFDPLNTSGSLVLNQNPLSIDYQKVVTIAVSGREFHRSRSCVIMNEDPLYIEYTVSAFGYVGRSVYQRALFPLKSFIQSMITDDMVTKKAGLIIAMIKQAGSIINQIMSAVTGLKRALLQGGVTGNVLSIGAEDKVESLNLINVNGAMSESRKNILENIAAADDMPAVILNNETFAQGFADGTEDSKRVAQYIDRERLCMDPLYKFFDSIVMYRAWNKDFLETLRVKYPDQFEGKSDNEMFIQFKNSFTAIWPSLLVEPESEQVKVVDVKLKAIIAVLDVFLPVMDPENKAEILKWAADNFNEQELMFQSPLVLDWDAIASYEPSTALDAPKEPGEDRPFAKNDSEGRLRRRADYDRAVSRYLESQEMKKRLTRPEPKRPELMAAE